MNGNQYVRPLSAESAGTAPGRGRLKGRRILVVGGGQQVFDAATDPVGNGRAISLLCAREGAKVAVADRNRPSAAETLAIVEREGGSGCAIQADISLEADITRMIDEARTALGGLDGMVLNVGGKMMYYHRSGNSGYVDGRELGENEEALVEHGGVIFVGKGPTPVAMIAYDKKGNLGLDDPVTFLQHAQSRWQMRKS